MQDCYRKFYMICKSCGKKAEVMHHHFTWKRSIALRTEFMNLVPLCQKCHFSFHKGDHKVKIAYETTMRELYGQDWEQQLRALELEHQKKSHKEWILWINDKITYYKELTPDM